MKARIVTPLAIALGIALGVTGCSLFAPQATTTHYDASDGTGATVGELAIRNAIVISDGGTSGNLVVTIANSGATQHSLGVQYKTAVGRTNATIPVDPKQTVVLGAGASAPLELKNIDSKPGSLMPIYFQYGDAPGHQLLVPVLTTAQSAYRNLGPSVPPASTPTPTPTGHVTPAQHN